MDAYKQDKRDGKADEDSKMRPRLYQQEMFEESMKRNTIVVMPTGSGKTAVAVLRIQHALQQCENDQLVWFIAPKVTLCEQQHHVLKAALPGYEHVFLSGADGPDKWTTQGLWDAVLNNVRIVASTPQVLLDALSHGFVHMQRMALLVFDEGSSLTLLAAQTLFTLQSTSLQGRYSHE